MAGATELDRQVAKNLKRLRQEAGLTQAQVASHLGIRYQSYQRLEGGKVSLRISLLDQLGNLYDKRLQDFLAPGETIKDPLIVKVQIVMAGATDETREAMMRAILNIKHMGIPND